MKVCVLSEYAGVRDEGMRNIAFHILRHLSDKHEVLHLSLRPLYRLSRPGFWRALRAFQPHIIHFVPGPSFKGLLLAKTAALCWPKAKLVLSATLPTLPRFAWRMMPVLKPDLVLAQSNRTQQRFVQAGCNTRLLPSGVDTDAFVPVSLAEKARLRDRYGIDRDVFLVLHVGPLRLKRNLLSLADIQKQGAQVVIVGSLSTPAETRKLRTLWESGCLVWHRYIENMPEIYAMADCYVFPTQEEGSCIEMPLSVMEAMSCNIPVVATRFGALPEVFTAGEGLTFVERTEQITQAVFEVGNNGHVATREKVLPYSWPKVMASLELIFREILNA